MIQTYWLSSAVNRPVWNSAAAMTPPNARNATAEGTTKNAIRLNPEFRRARSAAAISSSLPIALDMAGSSEAATDIPKRLTGSV